MLIPQNANMVMKKWTKIFLITAGSLAVLILIARITKALITFTVPTGSGYPTVKPGNYILASSLKKPERFDLICFYNNDPIFGRQISMYRLCGIAGDIVEIRNGVLYVNNQEADSKLRLAHTYMIPQSEMSKLDSLPEFAQLYRGGGDSLQGPIDDQLIRDRKIIARRTFKPAGEKEEGISTEFGDGPVNSDNVGPIVVPKGKYFLLGDNRDYARDSRYQGFIDAKEFVATVISKK